MTPPGTSDRAIGSELAIGSGSATTSAHGLAASQAGIAQDHRLAMALVGWLESGVRPDDLLADDAFADLTVPHWRLQASGADAVFRLREDSHPCPGTVAVTALDGTARGFLIEFEERWADQGQRWYSRELIHCIVDHDRIRELRIYCTGDWDEAVQRRHAEQVRLIRT